MGFHWVSTQLTGELSKKNGDGLAEARNNDDHNQSISNPAPVFQILPRDGKLTLEPFNDFKIDVDATQRQKLFVSF
jgi:hypothetical protein